MALWAQMTPQLQFLPTQILNELYPDTFPLDVRHYLASWIEEQRWYDITKSFISQLAMITLFHNETQSALIGQLTQCIVIGRTPQALIRNVTPLSIIVSFNFQNKCKDS
uniref:STAT transcription factor protein interaction domain-containing protein n=1 Tax=Cyprinus carpio TaxID=7962 RepID=A0A8C2H8J2_CYPCA